MFGYLQLNNDWKQLSHTIVNHTPLLNLQWVLQFCVLVKDQAMFSKYLYQVWVKEQCFGSSFHSFKPHSHSFLWPCARPKLGKGYQSKIICSCKEFDFHYMPRYCGTVTFCEIYTFRETGLIFLPDSRIDTKKKCKTYINYLFIRRYKVN